MSPCISNLDSPLCPISYALIPVCTYRHFYFTSQKVTPNSKEGRLWPHILANAPCSHWCSGLSFLQPSSLLLDHIFAFSCISFQTLSCLPEDIKMWKVTSTVLHTSSLCHSLLHPQKCLASNWHLCCPFSQGPFITSSTLIGMWLHLTKLPSSQTWLSLVAVLQPSLFIAPGSTVH